MLHHALSQDLSALCELSEANLLEATKTDERSMHEELRCVLAVVRHGDRTPKQKLKVCNAYHSHSLRRLHVVSCPGAAIASDTGNSSASDLSGSPETPMRDVNNVGKMS